MTISKPVKGPSKTKRQRWIAERRLERRDAVGGFIVVRIGCPEWPAGAEEWRCPFIIEGAGDDSVHYGRSIDSMAALQNALIGIRQLLLRTGIPLRWEGFAEDLTGFARDVPWEYGLEFYQQMEKLMDAKIAEFLEARDRDAKKREREAQRKGRKKP